MSDSAACALDLERIRAAAARISPHVLSTPCTESAWLSEVAGAPVWIKWESLQLTGSFKLRGALNKLLRLAERGVGEVLAVSAGNHGLGVAWAARLLGMRATIVVPEGAARTKVEAIDRLGATVEVRGSDYDDAEAEARRLAAERGLEFVSPYNDLDVIAGQGTAALELCTQVRFRTLLVPVGGGGLLAGAAVVVRALQPGATVIGVQPAHAPAMREALRAGAIVPVQQLPTCADGLSGNLEPGSVTLPLARTLVDRVELVSETSIERAIGELLAHEHMVVEGSGAVGVAALLEGRLRPPAPIAVLITGRNVDFSRLQRIVAAS